VTPCVTPNPAYTRVISGTSKPQRRSRGVIGVLPIGSLRVRVNAGVDPVTGKRHRPEASRNIGGPDGRSVEPIDVL
jgi:hypothetical protein